MLACSLPPSPPPPHLRSSAPLLLACPGPDSGFNKEEGGKNNPCFFPLLLPPPPHPLSPFSNSLTTFLYPPPFLPQIMLLLTGRGKREVKGREIKYGGLTARQTSYTALSSQHPKHNREVLHTHVPTLTVVEAESCFVLFSFLQSSLYTVSFITAVLPELLMRFV